MKQTISIDISDLFDADDWTGGTEHAYFSCKENDERPQNAYYNGCPRCVKIACAIADQAQLDLQCCAY